jgi:hypothetical protein
MAKPTIRIARPNIGLKRVSGSTPSAQAAVTRDIRTQFEDVKKNLNKVIEGIREITPSALVYGLLPIFDTSQVLVPVDEGDLKASGYLEVKDKAGGKLVEAEIGYGRGGDPHYAVFVHEDLQAYHEPPTQAKFLEAAINKHFDDIQPRIIKAIQEGIGMK